MTDATAPSATAPETPAHDSLLDVKIVSHRTKLGVSTIYRKVQHGLDTAPTHRAR